VPKPALKLVNLADQKLRIEFRHTDLSRKLPSKAGASLREQVETYWRIGELDNLHENVFNFDRVVKGRKVYISANLVSEGIKSGVPGAASRARDQKADVLALQLLLSSIRGVRQAESFHRSVLVVFIHARDWIGLSQSGQKANQFDQLRKHAPHCFVFGEAEVELKPSDPRRNLSLANQIKKKWFRSVWNRSKSHNSRRFVRFEPSLWTLFLAPGAVTFTPAVLVDHATNAQQIISVCDELARHRSSREGRHDISSYVPASCFVPGGPFAVKPLGPDHDKNR